MNTISNASIDDTNLSNHASNVRVKLVAIIPTSRTTRENKNKDYMYKLPRCKGIKTSELESWSPTPN